MADALRDSGPQLDERTPLWVKVFGGILLAAILFVVIIFFARGPHRPGGHGGSGGHTSRGSHR